jgi:hypothetical protein
MVAAWVAVGAVVVIGGVVVLMRRGVIGGKAEKAPEQTTKA